MKEKAGKILKYGISLVIAALCVWMVVKKVDWSGFVDGLACTRWGYIVLFIVASVLALVFRALRWRDLLKPLDDSTRLLDVWDSINVGNMANVALPGAGELLRCGLVATKKATYEKTLGTIVMERAWDFLAIGIVLVLALGMKWKQFGGFFTDNIVKPMSGRFGLWWVLLIAVLCCAAFVWAIYHFRSRSRICGKIAEKISGLAQGLNTFSKMEHKLLFASYTAGLWFMYVLMSYFGLKAVPALSDLGMVDALFISAVGNLASVIPVPSGMGPYHYLIMITLSGLYGSPEAIGVLYAVLCHESHAILIIILGIISYIRLTLGRRKSSEIKKN